MKVEASEIPAGACNRAKNQGHEPVKTLAADD
jgi:hypothetical protein